MAKLSEIVKEKLEAIGIKPASCKGCGESIIFLRTANGKLMPLGMDLSPHWKTCTNPERFRKKDQPAQTQTDEPEPDMEDLPI
jgi:hypothetical protein